MRPLEVGGRGLTAGRAERACGLARGGGERTVRRCQSEAHACGAGLARPIYWVGAGAS